MKSPPDSALISANNKKRVSVCFRVPKTWNIVAAQAYFQSNKSDNGNYVAFIYSYHKAQSFHLSTVLGAGGHDVNSGCVDAAVPQKISQLGNVLLEIIMQTLIQGTGIIKKCAFAV